MDQETLLVAARKVFLKLGYKHTNVAAITKEAKIATGSFYKFFDSKEAIFIVLYVKENNKLRNKIMAKLTDDVDLIQGVDTLMDIVFNEVKGNGILAEWYRPEIGPKLQAYYAETASDADYPFSSYLNNWLAKKRAALHLNEKQTQNFDEAFSFMQYLDEQFDLAGMQAHTGVLRKMVKAYLRNEVIGEE